MKPRRFSYIAFVIAGLLFATQASAQDTDAIFKLIAGNNLKQAQKAVDRGLNDNPGSAERGKLVFADALIADKNGNGKKAIGLYLQLIDSHPGLMGPYNNLAVHYAAKGDYKSAISTLEKALTANQAVATTYGNLQSIYARMASLAYRKALNSKTPTAPLELATIENSENVPGVASQPTLVASAENFIEQTLNATASGDNSEASVQGTEQETARANPQNNENNIVVAANSAASESSDAANDPVLVESTPATTEQATPVIKDATPVKAEGAEAIAVKQKEEVKTAAVSPGPTEEAKKLAEQSAAEKQALINHVKSWASAWSDRDVDRYLSHYSNGFTPRDNLSLDEWKKQRYGRLRWREFIIVKPSRYRIELDDDIATVNFNQYYKSERFEDTIRKTLKLRKENGKWRITHEFI